MTINVEFQSNNSVIDTAMASSDVEATAISDIGNVTESVEFQDGDDSIDASVTANSVSVEVQMSGAIITQSKEMALGASAPTTVTPDSGKALSSVVPSIDASVIKAENIKKDATMLGITGTYEGVVPVGVKDITAGTETKSVDVSGYATARIAPTPSESQTLTLGSSLPSTVTPSSGKLLSSVPVSLDTSIIKAENIAKNVVMLGIVGTHEGGITPTGTIEITENGTYDVTEKASANVSVSPSLQFKFANENGNYYPDEGFDGFSDFEVSVYPELEDKTITENGTYTAGSDYYGLGTVEVNVSGGGSKYGATIDSFFNDVTSTGLYSPPTETGTEEMVFTGLKSLTNSNNYPYIFAYKFAYCNPKKVSFPDLTYIGCQSAFQYGFFHSLVEEVSFPVLKTFNLSHAFYYGFQYASKLKKVSFNAVTDASKTYMFYYAFSYVGESNSDPTVVEFPNLTTISGSNAFANAFNHAYLGYGVLHPFPALTTISTTGILTSAFVYTNCIRYVFDKISVLNKTNMFTSAWQYCLPASSTTYNETYGIMFPLLTTIGVSGSASSYTVFKSCCNYSNTKMNAYFSSLTAIYNNNTTASNSHFGTCGLVKVFLPKVTDMGTASQYAFYGSTTITELHFGIENQATIEAISGYSSKFGATSATIYFDLANHLTINGAVYDRNGNYDDYDEWYFGFTDEDSGVTYYINEYYGTVGDVAYTKSGDTYTATSYTVTVVA